MLNWVQKITILGLLVYPINFFGQLTKSIGSSDLSDWAGLKGNKNGIINMVQDQEVAYRYPDGKRYYHGFRQIKEDVADWSGFSGITLDVYIEKASEIKLCLSFKVPERDKESLNPVTKTIVTLHGSGWNNVFIPWSQFQINEGQLEATLRSVKEFSIKALVTGNNKVLKIKNIKVSKGQLISIDCKIRGKSAKAGESVIYNIEAGNTSDIVSTINFKIKQEGWESMKAVIEPQEIVLQPGETKQCLLTVSLASHLPQGVRETQVLEAYPNGMGASKEILTFETVVSLSKPNILHTNERWQRVKNNVENYNWAKEELAKYEKTASEWKVPQIATEISDDNPDKGLHIFRTQEEHNLMAGAIAYRITGKKEYAEKVAIFLRRLISEKNGYPATFRGCHQSSVQEGHFFQHIAMSYDMIADAGVLTKEDIVLIENTFRLFIETVRMGFGQGAINNWALSSITGALYCALAIEDWFLANDILHHHSGVYNHLKQGVMADGWWYECSISYNVWCSSEFSQIALALDPWGINFKDMKLPIGTTPYYSLMPDFKKPGLYGMNFEKWGTLNKNFVSIKDMWDAILPFVDYRGIMFAVNDAQENEVSGQPYELAYYLYQDPEYAAVVNRGGKRDLLYGLGELPAYESELVKKSAFADNIGIVQLRSQTEGREQREQIQAALHYGTHGGYHGHFDRTNFLSMMRYGRSFYNPEMIWYGYPSYLYKFLVQTSMTKNMVVVDQKMQEPKESYRTLFYEGKMFQATAVETNARWSNPPYGGMQYDYLGGISFAEKAWREGREIDIPEKAPVYGSVTDFTKPVLQRRVMVMMDDYIVLADYLKAENEHTYDWLFHAKGLKGIESETKTYVRHDNQMSNNPLGSAQFFTDCNWYNTSGTARSSFETCWGKNCDNTGTRAPHSEEGVLKIDIYNAWPLANEIMTATTPESHDNNLQVWYSIEADGEALLKDSAGVWILGHKNINIDISGKKELVLSTRINDKNRNCLFWGNSKILLKNGDEMELTDLPFVFKNVKSTESINFDYFGGPVKIGGEQMKTAFPAVPENIDLTAEITIDLSHVDASRFETIIGSDYPFGDEAPRRKTLAVRTHGKETNYLSVIEPYETEPVIENVKALSWDKLLVTLKDGRVQEITIENINEESRMLKVAVTEKMNGATLREESTISDSSVH